ncbi:MAG: site-2 protease family protein [Oscillospiraceae bacterium]
MLLAAFLFYVDGTVILLAGFAAFLHELGHCMVLSLLGGRVEALRITVIGAELKLDRTKPLSYPKEFAVALSGPLVSLLAAWVSARLGCFLFAGLSLALGVFNLLPVWVLDGGRALYAATAGLTHEVLAAKLTYRASCLTIAALVGLGIGTLVRYGNLTLLLTALWLLSGAVAGQTRRRR